MATMGRGWFPLYTYIETLAIISETIGQNRKHIWMKLSEVDFLQKLFKQIWSQPPSDIALSGLILL